MVEQIKKGLKTPQGKLKFSLMTIVMMLFAVSAMGLVSPAKPAVKDIRNIVLEIRNMAFGDNNPTIYLDRGETVKFVIHNLDPGMKHNFTIDGTDIRTPLLDYDEKESVLFTAPATEEERVYFCMPHALHMKGLLRVQ